jgi:glyoxylase-like metal-dependent hydrolase (beta-lactamase superfamily II)
MSKATKIISVLVLFSVGVASAWNIKGVGSYKFENFTANVWVMHGPLQNPTKQNQGFMNNPGVVIGKNAVIMVDPGGNYHIGKQVLAELEKITDKPVAAVFNSHIHGDHWLANHAIKERYPDVKIYADPRMIAAAKAGDAESWLSSMSRMTEGVSDGTKSVLPDVAVNNGDKLVIAGETFVIHSVGGRSHTNTDILVEHLDSKTMFLGDVGFNKRLGRFDNTSSIYGNIAMLEAIDTNKVENFVPGHGRSGSYDKSVKPFLSYMKLIAAGTKRGYDEGLADYEIKPALAEKAKEYQDWSGFEGALGKHISKMYLEVEERDL